MKYEGHTMRKCVIPLILVLLAASPALAEEEPVMVLEGDVSAVHDSGAFTVIDPLHPEILQSWRARTGSPSPTPGYELPPADRPFGTIAQAPIGPDGTFRLEVTVDTPRLVYFLVIDPDAGNQWRPWEITNANRFILEPGELRLRAVYSNYSLVSGGQYNDAVYGSWRESDEYREAQAEYSRSLARQEGETEEARIERSERRWEIEARLKKLEWEANEKLRDTQPDQLTQQLASNSVMAFEPVAIALIRVLNKTAPDGAESGEETSDQEFSLNLPPAIIYLENRENDPEKSDGRPTSASEVGIP